MLVSYRRCERHATLLSISALSFLSSSAFIGGVEGGMRDRCAQVRTRFYKAWWKGVRRWGWMPFIWSLQLLYGLMAVPLFGFCWSRNPPCVAIPALSTPKKPFYCRCPPIKWSARVSSCGRDKTGHWPCDLHEMTAHCLTTVTAIDSPLIITVSFIVF